MRHYPASALRTAFMFLLLGTTAISPAYALTYLVGAGSVPTQCDFNSLQQAIDAAAANPGVDFIRIASDQTYTAQALSIGQQDLTITGGYASCAAALPAGALPTGSTILSGAGGAAAPVISISGSGVRVLNSLQIRNGDNVQGDGSGCGGGIRFNGRGELRLGFVGLSQNQANHGGGICFAGTAQPSALSLLGDTVINNNIATTGNGGGIAIAGIARLFALEDRILIAFNEAPEGNGGGVYLQAPARLDIGSPGFANNGVLFANLARRGGGMAGLALDADDDDACARFFSTDATRPVRIHGNRASEFGGGLYLRSKEEGSATQSLMLARAYDFRFDDNTAPNGPAAFLQGDQGLFGSTAGALLALNRGSGYSACDAEPLADLGRIPCTNVAQCNRIENNRAQDLNGQASNGNVIELRLGSRLFASGLSLVNNQGTRLISWSEGGNFAGVDMNRCALTGNLLSQELLRGFNDGDLGLRDCTLAGNSIGAAQVLRLDDGASMVALRNLVIDQPGKQTLSHPAVSLATVDNQWVVATEVASLRPDPTLQQASGRFNDPARGDYRLRIGSQAVDFTPAAAEPSLDLDGRPRDVDLDEATANTRVRDAGGYERQLDDPWLQNGDFIEDLRLWSNPNPAHSTWNGEFNAPGSVGGSLLFSVPSDQVGPTERRTALTQCFNVPSAGLYRIVGQARVVGFSSLNHDYPILAWRLRYASGDCSGLASATGETSFGRSTGWAPLIAPLLIEVDAAQWTWNTSIEVLLDVAQSPASVTATALVAGFDEIEILRIPTGPAVFSDGFEAL